MGDSSEVDVFVSYAHEDRDYLESLEKHLSLLKREKLIRLWHDRKIIPGQQWEQMIDVRLDSARLILLLISHHFIDSDYCWQREMSRALELDQRGAARVLPILLLPCDWESAPFARLQVLPSDAKPISEWSDRNQAYRDIAKGIRAVLADLAVARSSGPNDGARAEQELQDAHLTRLRSGIVSWNNWRAANPHTVPELAGAMLSGADLSGANLARANLAGADLSLSVLDRADLRGADLVRANLTESSLRNTNLQNADLQYANLESAVFGGTIIVGANLAHAERLATIVHQGRSHIDISARTHAELPAELLTGCGLTALEIAWDRARKATTTAGGADGGRQDPACEEQK